MISKNTTEMRIPSNKVKDIERYIKSELKTLYPVEELRNFVQMLFEAILGWNQVQLLMHGNDTINQSDLLKFHWSVEELRQYRPIQYIIGYTDFCHCRIGVKEGVLIPRPETEEIISATAILMKKEEMVPQIILDICTGSGCIAIALAKEHPDANIYAVDISPEAIAIAKDNADKNGVDIQFDLCDIIHEEPRLPVNQFDLIISNPPYICEREKSGMMPNVLSYEPQIALFVPDNDPMLFYRSIGRYAQQHLSSKGLLVLEINERYGNETIQILTDLGFAVEIKKDFWGKDRMALARRSRPTPYSSNQ